MSFYVKAMRKQLTDLGVASEIIYHFYDVRRLIDLEKNRQDIEYHGISEQGLEDRAKTSIALLSTDLALGGTAIALFHMAEALKKPRYSIVFGSMMDGPLRECLEERDIPVIIDPNLQLATMRETAWLAGFRLIICNAVNYYFFLSKRDLGVPMIWWLHDSSFFYDGVDREVLRKLPAENLTILSVGPVPEKAVHESGLDMPVGELLYGVEDTEGILRKKVCFVTIGHIEERKGQDLLLQAVRLLKEDERRKAVFYLVGQDTSLLAGQIRERAASIPEMIVTGPVDREGIEEILRRADVMICPSREDPMPTVAAEAMMHGVPCILSDAAGTASYVTGGKDDLCFPSGDVAELSGKISWCIENRDRLAGMGRRAREIYEERFSMDMFEKKVRLIMESLL